MKTAVGPHKPIMLMNLKMMTNRQIKIARHTAELLFSCCPIFFQFWPPALACYRPLRNGSPCRPLLVLVVLPVVLLPMLLVVMAFAAFGLMPREVAAMPAFTALAPNLRHMFPVFTD